MKGLLRIEARSSLSAANSGSSHHAKSQPQTVRTSTDTVHTKAATRQLRHATEQPRKTFAFSGTQACCLFLLILLFFGSFLQSGRKREALGGTCLLHLPFRRLLRPGLLWSGAAGQVSGGVRRCARTLPAGAEPKLRPAAPRAVFTT